MTEHPSSSKFMAAGGAGAGPRVGVVDGALGGDQQLASIAAFFPLARFQSVGAAWPDTEPQGLDVLIVTVDATKPADLEAAVRRLRAWPMVRTVVMLRNADVASTRMLVREGAADVVPFPTTDAAITISLDGLFSIVEPSDGGGARGQVTAFLKAGGGVGATALAVQAGALLASGGAEICVADLDLQFGAVGAYLDLSEAVTITDCVGAGLQDVSLVATLARHRSGLRVMAGPRQLMPLEAMAPQQVEALIEALKRDFTMSFLDMPSVWTAWTNRALQLAEHIVVVTHLSVPHLHLVDRQLQVLKAQGLDGRRLTLVINSLAPEQSASLSLKAAERALGREFAITIPEDRKVMTAALNQGVEIAAIKRGTKLERAIADFAHSLAPAVAGQAQRKRR